MNHESISLEICDKIGQCWHGAPPHQAIEDAKAIAESIKCEKARGAALKAVIMMTPLAYQGQFWYQLAELGRQGRAMMNDMGTDRPTRQIKQILKKVKAKQ